MRSGTVSGSSQSFEDPRGRPSTYYSALSHPSSRRNLRDTELKAHIGRVFEDNYGVYGARKVWRQRKREGIPVARCSVERLRRQMGLAGPVRGRRRRPHRCYQQRATRGPR